MSRYTNRHLTLLYFDGGQFCRLWPTTATTSKRAPKPGGSVPAPHFSPLIIGGNCIMCAAVIWGQNCYRRYWQIRHRAVSFSTVVLKPSFSQMLSLYSHYIPSWDWSPGILTTRCLAVSGKWSRLSQPSWLLGALKYSHTYLLTYIHATIMMQIRATIFVALSGRVNTSRWRELAGD